MSKRKQKAQKRARLRKEQKRRRKENKLNPKPKRPAQKKPKKEPKKKPQKSVQTSIFDDYELDSIEPEWEEEDLSNSNSFQDLLRSLYRQSDRDKKDKYGRYAYDLNSWHYTYGDYVSDMIKFANIKGKKAAYVKWDSDRLGYNVSEKILDFYFYFRSEAKKGHFIPSDFNYFLLYFNELVNMIGVDSKEEALDKLTDLYFRLEEELNERGKRILAENIYDFLVFHNIDIRKLNPRFWYYIEDYGRRLLGVQLMSNTGSLELPFNLIYSFSEIDLPKKSKIFLDDIDPYTEAIMNVVYLVDYVLRKTEQTTILDEDDIINYPVYFDPFESVPLDTERVNIDQELNLKFYPGMTHEKFSAIIQEVENAFREVYGIRGRLRKYFLKDWQKDLIFDFIQKTYNSPDYHYTGTFEPAKNYLKSLEEKQTINLDLDRLEELRAETEIVQDLMEVEEEIKEERTPELLEPLTRVLMGLSKKSFSIIENIEADLNNKSEIPEDLTESIETEARRYLNQPFLIEVDNKEHISEYFRSTLKQIFSQKDNYPFLLKPESSEISDFLDELEPVEKEFIKIIVNNKNALPLLEELAQSEMTMVEILLDDINNKALLYLDDIILEMDDENTPQIIEEYSDQLKSSLEME